MKFLNSEILLCNPDNMSEEFKIIHKEVVGKVEISVNMQIHNLKADEVTVCENITARLFGSIQKKLILKKGSKVFLHGVLFGDVKNEGGELHVF